MKLSHAASIRPSRRTGAIAAVAGLALSLFGCAGAEYEPARYPPPPEPSAVVGSSVGASSEAAPVTPVQVQAQAQVTGTEEADGVTVRPQAGDIQIGVDENSYPDTDPSALTDFRATLDPYGTWVDDSSYGTVWVPSTTVVGADFAPYVSAGHWTYDSDYVWVSDYDWGWAPFHYGRWIYIGGRGWGWIPGRVYSGAWVTWRVGDPDYGYVGWAPLPPLWYWRDGYAVGFGYAPRAPYVFCGTGDMFRPHVGAHVVVGARVGEVAGHTRPYVAASPRIPASPGVGRGVGGGVGGRVAANPSVGPSPSSLGIRSDQVRGVPADHQGLVRAQQFSQPKTALALGGHAPVAFAPRPTALPASGPQAESYRGPSRLEPVARAPQYRNVAPAHHDPAFSPPQPQPFAASRMPSHTLGSSSSAAPVYRSSPSAAMPSAPAYRSSPSAPAFRSSASAPTHRQAPSAPSPRYNAPSVYHQPSAPSYRSAPSAPSFHTSTPSVARPSSGGGGGVRGSARGHR